MPRKKRNQTETTEAMGSGVAVAEPETMTAETTGTIAEPKASTSESAIATAEPPATGTLPPIETPAWIDGPPVPLPSGEVVPAEGEAEQPKQWGNPYKAIFTSTEKGFEMGENRRFKQRVFLFRERPEQAVIDRLKDNGFTYRAAEKAWTIEANAETRKVADDLAREFADLAQGHSLFNGPVGACR